MPSAVYFLSVFLRRIPDIIGILPSYGREGTEKKIKDNVLADFQLCTVVIGCKFGRDLGA